MAISRLARALLPALGLALIAVACYGLSGPDLPPGPYCASHPRGSDCCRGREDGCSAPILGTLCYCDDFCNRTRNEDCCPDFWSHCHGIEEPPLPIITCYHEGKGYMLKGQKVTENCNDCTCSEINGRAEMVCDSDPCMVEEQLLDSVNNDAAATWRASNHTPFWGHKLAEGLKLRLGTLTPQKSTLGMYPLRPVYDPNKLPSRFDARQQWAGQLAPIQDQGWCGSSWAISTAAVASDKFVIMSKGVEHPQLSAQQLVACNSRGQRSCSGGYLDRAWQFIRKFGLVDEECLPYNSQEQKCKMPRKGTLQGSGCKSPQGIGRLERYHVSPAYRLGNETDIMYEILNSGPAQATMKVYQDLFSYNGGIYRKSRNVPEEYGYHSVRLVGWGIEDGIKYWVAANSWGEQWGEGGYFRIRRGINECEVETFVIGAWANTINPKSNNRFPANMLRRRG